MCVGYRSEGKGNAGYNGQPWLANGPCVTKTPTRLKHPLAENRELILTAICCNATVIDNRNLNHSAHPRLDLDTGTPYVLQSIL